MLFPTRPSLGVLSGALAVMTLLLLPATAEAQALLQWNTFGNAGTETSEPSVFNDTNISAASLTLGAGVTAAGNANRFGGSNWFNTGNTNPSTLAEAIAGNNFIQFTLTPNSGFQFTATSFTFSWDRSNTGPSSVALRSSLDGFAANLGQVTGLAAAVTTGNTITISGLTNVTTAVTFRLYGFAATATGGTGGFDTATNAINVQLLGSTSAISAIPEPTTVLAGVGAALALGWRSRRRLAGLLRRR